MNNKKIILVVVSIIIIIGISAFAAYKKQSGNTPTVSQTPTSFAEMKPLPPVDETNLQQKIQQIVTKGKESECDTLSDPRYVSACHSFFSSKTTTK